MYVYMESESLAAGQATQSSITKQNKSPKPSTSKQLKSESILSINQLEMSEASTEYKITATAQKPLGNQTSLTKVPSVKQSLKAKTWIMTKEMETQIKMKRMVSLMSSENKMK